ncbi:NEK/NEK2 protein kinase [Salpingoeca rosetta]|uniref:non-specific serine/threonine protein kinase n=1 Tax=Salpingoeca rosetta (strain ATCC 50818 / BSB-021) TaxID=946362 RepID=F2ULL0_SALR5|nr:NEK/NEK2 protein kinase [Salpingoeca rosetta]EGD78009.1 NEK/NEK2 protein kinase [Salpingoeca rosetta]|eukprot:XP_004990071.1 NEK/NEK2 protein kinase [Salpingoeca rosetta]
MSGGTRKKHSTTCDDFIVLESIGTGTFGICSKVMRKSDRKILVWKELNYGKMTEREKQMLVSEVNILRELRHENIVRYYDRIIDRSRTTIYIVMEYCEGGDLSGVIQQCKRTGTTLEEPFIRRVFKQVLLALQECHLRSSGKVMHRDLKPANIFLDRDHNAKLGDFGLARVLASKAALAHTFVGTPYYMSPEQITERAYNEKSDMWSLGCIVYELAALRPPFDASCQASLARRIRKGRFSPLPSRYSAQLNAIVTSMLQQDPRKRPSAEELLEHSYFAQPPSPRAGSDLTPVPLCAHCSRRIGRAEMWSDAGSSEESSCSSHSSAHDKAADLRQLEASLKAREQRLLTRERALEQRERDLRLREKYVQQREQLLDMARERTNPLATPGFDARLQKRLAGIGLQEITNIFP